MSSNETCATHPKPHILFQLMRQLEELLRDPAPPAWRFDSTASTKKQVGNGTVYFTTPYPAQLRANGSAYGASIGASNLGVQHEDVDIGSGDDSPTAKALQ
jgi:hypothetical protein